MYTLGGNNLRYVTRWEYVAYTRWEYDVSNAINSYVDPKAHAHESINNI